MQLYFEYYYNPLDFPPTILLSGSGAIPSWPVAAKSATAALRTCSTPSRSHSQARPRAGVKRGHRWGWTVASAAGPGPPRCADRAAAAAWRRAHGHTACEQRPGCLVLGGSAFRLAPRHAHARRRRRLVQRRALPSPVAAAAPGQGATCAAHPFATCAAASRPASRRRRRRGRALGRRAGAPETDTVVRPSVAVDGWCASAPGAVVTLFCARK